MNVLVACEFSGLVRDAFECLGHRAASCDLRPSEAGGEHYQEDIFETLENRGPWDLIVAHPDCTAMTVSGNGTYAGTEAREQAVGWTLRLFYTMKQRAKRVAMENPTGVLGSWWRPADQWIQPWQFGHNESKATGLWLHNLRPLVPVVTQKPTNVEQRIWKMAPSEDRGKERSRTYPGIAKAMAAQWGGVTQSVLF